MKEEKKLQPAFLRRERRHKVVLSLYKGSGRLCTQVSVKLNSLSLWDAVYTQATPPFILSPWRTQELYNCLFEAYRSLWAPCKSTQSREPSGSSASSSLKSVTQCKESRVQATRDSAKACAHAHTRRDVTAEVGTRRCGGWGGSFLSFGQQVCVLFPRSAQ